MHNALDATSSRNNEPGYGNVILPTVVGDNTAGIKRIPGTETYKGRPAWIMRYPDLRRLERVCVFTDFIAEAMFKKVKLLTGVETVS